MHHTFVLEIHITQQNIVWWVMMAFAVVFVIINKDNLSARASRIARIILSKYSK